MIRLKQDDILAGLLLGVALCTGFSLTLGRLMTALLLLGCAAACLRGHLRCRVPAVCWVALVFVLWAAFVTATGPNPEAGVGRLSKLLWYSLIMLTAMVIRGRGDIGRALAWYAAGTGIGALVLCTESLGGAWLACREALQAGETASFLEGVIHRGGMTVGQILMLGVVISVSALCRPGAERRIRWRWVALLALQTAALVVNFKRGSWGATLLAVGLLLLLRGRLRVLAVAVVAACSLLLLPGVQVRLGALRHELQLAHGGRLVMWTQIAPELRSRYPRGVGFRSLTSAMMEDAAAARGVYIEPGRNHLHSNPLQILVATGRPGVVLYLLWGGLALWYCLRARRTAAGPEGKQQAECLLALLIALWANGLIEYNFADAQIVLSYSLIMGLAVALVRLPEAEAVDLASQPRPELLEA